MKFPHVFSVLGHTFNVSLVDPGSDVGEIWVTKGIVRIRPDQSADALRDTYMHEILHAAVALSGLASAGGVLHDENAAEAVVTTLATVLLDTFRRNRQVTDFLLEGGEYHADWKAAAEDRRSAFERAEDSPSTRTSACPACACQEGA